MCRSAKSKLDPHARGKVRSTRLSPTEQRNPRSQHLDLMSTRDAVALMLKGVLGVDVILIGDDDHWLISGRELAVGLVVLPDPEQFSHKLDPVLGKTWLYLPDGSQPFEIESHYDEDVKINNYDHPRPLSCPRRCRERPAGCQVPTQVLPAAPRHPFQRPG